MVEMIKVSFRIEPSLNERLEDYAATNGFNKSALIRLAVVGLMKKRGIIKKEGKKRCQ